ncbi:ABC transporter ATP-binding protein [Nakamurella sp. A5-74]|uniref:ABC transporter ATP-binding protein n=1 Tax=Nakamurella sp. A5-74 TaxID=3158264 RepID=A0AAU8DUX7_9ACTN
MTVTRPDDHLQEQATGPERSPEHPARAPGGPGWIRRLLRYCRRYPFVTGMTVVGSGSLAINALTPLLTRAVVDDVTQGRPSASHWAILGLVAVAVALFGTTFLRRWAAGKLSLDVQHDLRQDVFTAIQRLDGPGQDSLRTGQVVSRANSDLQLVQGLMSIAPMAFGQIALAVVSFVIMIVLSPLLTLTAVLVVPAGIVLLRTFRDQLLPANWIAQQAAADVADVVEENVTGVRVVKGFGQEDREVAKLSAAARTLYRFRLRAARITARTNLLVSVTTFGQVLVLLLGGWLTINGRISLGTFVAFTLYVASLVGPTRFIVMLFSIGQQAGAAVDRVLQIVDLDASIVDPAEPLPVPPGPLDVRFDDLSFGYSAEAVVLQRFSLHVQAGSTVAVIGPSGSGKSTLSLLLPRFYEPSEGSVRIGGRDLRDLRLAELRATVGVVFEEAFLFSASISDNIRYGRPDATDAEVREAAVAAEADGFIAALPEGFDTVIGERGLTLSGGQRQRLALARAMITDPRVLILDDATSAVDPSTEAAILQTLHRVTADRTTILIAHRRSTLGLADTVAVMDRGRLVDHGTQEELALRCALFRRLLGSDLHEAPESLLPGPDGITQALWPDEPGRSEDDPAELVLDATAREPVAGKSGGRTGGRGGAVGEMASAPLTPDLAAKIRALPPALDEPESPAATGTLPGRAAGSAADPEQSTFSLRSALAPVKGLMLTAVVLVALGAATGAALPALLRAGIDHGVRPAAMSTVLLLTCIAAVVVLLDYLIQRGQAIITARAGESVLFHLRTRTFRHLQRLGLDYYEREMAGRIMTRMTTDVDALSSFLQTGLVQALVSIATFAAIAIALLVMNAGLALVAFAALPVLVVATFFFRRYSAAQYTKAREQSAEVNADLQENVAGLRVAQALGRQGRNSRRFSEKSDAYRRTRMRAQVAIALYFPFVAFLADLASAGTLLVGSTQVAAGTLTAGTLLAFVLYLNNFFTPIQQLSQVFDGYQQAAVSLRRIDELLNTPTSVPPARNPVVLADVSGEVDLRGVSFRYAPDTPWALQDLEFRFVPGETVAVVGATGAGKSTLVKLIARYYDVTEGAVLIDGTDLRTLELQSYRRHLAVVPQEPHLFSGTIRDNIAYGRPEATDAEVEAAARSVGALEVIGTLPGGFHHRIAERGRNLAAGQRQLVSLARAHLVDPAILLLDEATAALDPAAELAVLQGSDELATGRTTIVVAHRLATAERADRIIVMEHGRVVEIGAHAELLGREGAYAALYGERER